MLDFPVSPVMARWSSGALAHFSSQSRDTSGDTSGGSDIT